jgi:hypothetical protein
MEALEITQEQNAALGWVGRGTVIQQNFLKAYEARCGTTYAHFPSMSHGANIRMQRTSGVEDMAIKIRRAGYLESSIIMIWEDRDWAARKKKKLLIEIWAALPGPKDTLARIPVTKDEVSERKFFCIDGMHRQGAMMKLSVEWRQGNPTADPESNPYVWGQIAWIFDEKKLKHLVTFLAQEANVMTESYVGTTYLDRLSAMRANYKCWVKDVVPNAVNKNGNALSEQQLETMKLNITQFSEWYHATMDNSVKAVTHRVIASVAMRLEPESMDHLIAKFMSIEVPYPFFNVDIECHIMVVTLYHFIVPNKCNNLDNMLESHCII